MHEGVARGALGGVDDAEGRRLPRGRLEGRGGQHRHRPRVRHRRQGWRQKTHDFVSRENMRVLTILKQKTEKSLHKSKNKGAQKPPNINVGMMKCRVLIDVFMYNNPQIFAFLRNNEG